MRPRDRSPGFSPVAGARGSRCPRRRDGRHPFGVDRRPTHAADAPSARRPDHRRHEGRDHQAAGRERRRRARRGSQPERAGFLLHRNVQHNVTQPRQRRLPGTRKRDGFRADTLDDGHYVDDLIGLPAVGEHDDDVALGYNSQIAVHALGGMEKKRRSSRAGEDSRQLPGNSARFADTGDDRPAAASEQQLYRPVEAVVQPVRQRPDGIGFGPDHFAGKRYRIGYSGVFQYSPLP